MRLFVPSRNWTGRRAVAAWVRLRRFARSRTGQAIVAAWAALALLVGLRAYDPRLVVELKERTFDTYQRLKPRQHADFPVRIVDIDEASIREFGQWPWPRTRLAELTRRLSEAGAGAIAFDVIFSEPDRTSPAQIAEQLRRDGAGGEEERQRQLLSMLGAMPDHDRAFAEAIKATPTVLGFAASLRVAGPLPLSKAGISFAGADPAAILHPFGYAVASLPMFNAAASGMGAINLSAHDRSGIVRRVPLLFSGAGQIYPGLAVEALRVAQSQPGLLVRGTGASGDLDSGRPALIDMRVGDFRIPLTRDGEAWIYFDHDRPSRYISAKDVLDPAKEASVRPLLEGHIVLVGTSAVGLLDVRTTPLGEIVPGVSIHAQLIEQILGQDFISRPDWADGFEIMLTAVLGALIAWLLIAFGAKFSFVAGILALAIAIAGSWLAFSQLHLLIDPVYPSLAAIMIWGAVEGVLHIATDREKKFVRQAFGQYLAPELLHRLEQSPKAMQLGGEQREITVMFMDVRGFTPISEKLTATELVVFINTLLAPLSDAIQHELGTIDKYIGDSIMAFWNAPLDIPGHAARACRAALAMRAVVRKLNADDAFEFEGKGLGEVKIGVGLNAGEACVGNMGSARRFNYSAMGDVVNTAARIESASKSFGTDLLASDDVVRAADGLVFLEAGEILLKGKSRPTKVYAIAGDETFAALPETQQLVRHHADLVAALHASDLPTASRALADCRRICGEDLTSLYDHFAERLAATGQTAGGELRLSASAQM